MRRRKRLPLSKNDGWVCSSDNNKLGEGVSNFDKYRVGGMNSDYGIVSCKNNNEWPRDNFFFLFCCIF